MCAVNTLVLVTSVIPNWNNSEVITRRRYTGPASTYVRRQATLPAIGCVAGLGFVASGVYILRVTSRVSRQVEVLGESRRM